MLRRTFVLLASATLGCAHAPSDASSHRDLLFVTNEASGDVTVIDTRTDAVASTIPVGKRPRGLRVSPDGRWLYVAVSGALPAPPGQAAPRGPADHAADGIAVIDIARRAVVRVLPAGDDPENFDLSPDGARLYVANEGTGTATIVDVATGRVVARVRVGDEPEGVATRPDGDAVYVTSEGDARVTVIAPDGHVLGSFAAGARPRSVVFTRDGVLAFVSAEQGAAVTVADARRHRVVATIAIGAPGARPMGLALSPDDARLYVSNGRGNSVTAIDVAARRAVATFPSAGERAWGIAVTPDGRRLYVANGLSDDVAVLDASSGAVAKRIRVGSRPWGVALGR